MRETNESIDQFLELLRTQAERKADLYDGTNTAITVDECLRYTTEELGEVASAVTRDRTKLAQYECLDLAHCAMLIWLALRRNHPSSKLNSGYSERGSHSTQKQGRN